MCTQYSTIDTILLTLPTLAPYEPQPAFFPNIILCLRAQNLLHSTSIFPYFASISSKMLTPFDLALCVLVGLLIHSYWQPYCLHVWVQ